MTKHKHYDCIVAWANGATIQARRDSTEPWDTLHNTPLWNPDIEYRIKPEVRQYRVGVTSTGHHVVAINEKHADALGICRWLTDWVEYEV